MYNKHTIQIIGKNFKIGNDNEILNSIDIINFLSYKYLLNKNCK